MNPQQIALYLTANSVLSTDPTLYGYGFNNANPIDTTPGSIHIWRNNDIYIMNTSNEWKKLNIEV